MDTMASPTMMLSAVGQDDQQATTSARSNNLTLLSVVAARHELPRCSNRDAQQQNDEDGGAVVVASTSSAPTGRSPLKGQYMNAVNRHEAPVVNSKSLVENRVVNPKVPTHYENGGVVCKNAAAALAPPASAMEREYVEEEDITPSDVLCERGGKSYRHIGNIRYRKIVSEMKATYRDTAFKTDKTDMSRSVVECVCGYNGRFLKKDKGGRYYVMTMSEARRRTSQAFRAGWTDDANSNLSRKATTRDEKAGRLDKQNKVAKKTLPSHSHSVHLETNGRASNVDHQSAAPAFPFPHGQRPASLAHRPQESQQQPHLEPGIPPTLAHHPRFHSQQPRLPSGGVPHMPSTLAHRSHVHSKLPHMPSRVAPNMPLTLSRRPHQSQQPKSAYGLARHAYTLSQKPSFANGRVSPTLIRLSPKSLQPKVDGPPQRHFPYGNTQRHFVHGNMPPYAPDQRPRGSQPQQNPNYAFGPSQPMPPSVAHCPHEMQQPSAIGCRTNCSGVKQPSNGTGIGSKNGVQSMAVFPSKLDVIDLTTEPDVIDLTTENDASEPVARSSALETKQMIGKWTEEEDAKLVRAVKKCREANLGKMRNEWIWISRIIFKGRHSAHQCWMRYRYIQKKFKQIASCVDQMAHCVEPSTVSKPTVSSLDTSKPLKPLAQSVDPVNSVAQVYPSNSLEQVGPFTDPSTSSKQRVPSVDPSPLSKQMVSSVDPSNSLEQMGRSMGSSTDPCKSMEQMVPPVDPSKSLKQSFVDLNKSFEQVRPIVGTSKSLEQMAPSLDTCKSFKTGLHTVCRTSWVTCATLVCLGGSYVAFALSKQSGTG